MRNIWNTSRRDFLRYCPEGILGFSASSYGDHLVPLAPARTRGRSRVCVAHDPHLRTNPAGNALNSERVLHLLDRAMQSLFEAADPIEPWTHIVRAGQRIGLKVNTLAGRGLSTSVTLVEAICNRLQRADIRARDIVIWDRDTAEMEHAGFHPRIGGTQVQCFGTDRVGFSSELASFGSVGSQLSRILIEKCDVLINVPVLKDHDGAGVSIALKNMYGAISNPNKYHPNGCNPYIADLNMLPEIRNRLCLHICDAITACYEGGPGFKPEFTWKANSLLVSQDPVALDWLGWQMIDRNRVHQGMKTLESDGRKPQYIMTAADSDHQLGNSDPRYIEVLEQRDPKEARNVFPDLFQERASSLPGD